MKYTDEFLKKVVNIGLLGYDVEKSINVLDDIDDESKFRLDFSNPQSEIYKAYKKGLDKSDYMIDLRLYQMASTGDLKALQKYEERKAYQRRK